VEAIGRNSNLSHLCKRWSELRKRISEAPQRPASSGTPPRSKRFLLPTDIDDIVHRYDGGETTQQIGAHFRISKSRVATVLREQGITIRRQGLTSEQSAEAQMLYSDSKSLAWLGAPTTFPIRPSLQRFGAKACNCGPAQVGVKPRCSLETHKGY
jgi:hypothetical protein